MKYNRSFVNANAKGVKILIETYVNGYLQVEKTSHD